MESAHSGGRRRSSLSSADVRTARRLSTAPRKKVTGSTAGAKINRGDEESARRGEGREAPFSFAPSPLLLPRKSRRKPA
jgi:hypothetical protein